MSYRALVSSSDRVVKKIRESAASLKFRCVCALLVASFAEFLDSIRCSGEAPDNVESSQVADLVPVVMRYAGCPSPALGTRARYISPGLCRPPE